ncbi:hypothetical protein D9613_009853 [Agrocybe pediades]|uniref:N-acetyltransferase domain-containing protein n=1 Tax=Agrocybe pediades TaxID=84607 RepID=A0A8H4QWV9_9AGAR|nr:hypothetical protein D9613_009853 [Agrocybe pediades]
MATKEPRYIKIRSRSPKSRILLRTPLLTDVPAFTARANDPECVKYLPHLLNPKNPITNESNTKNCRQWRAESGIVGYFLVVVLLPEDGTKANQVDATIGDTGIIPINWEEKSGECGMMLNSGPLIRGKGYAIEAIDMQFAFGYDHLGLEKIYFGTDADNIPMQNLLEKKLGIPGRFREKEGDWEYVTTKSWWEERKRLAGEDRVEVEVEEMGPEEQ